MFVSVADVQSPKGQGQRGRGIPEQFGGAGSDIFHLPMCGKKDVMCCECLCNKCRIFAGGVLRTILRTQMYIFTFTSLWTVCTPRWVEHNYIDVFAASQVRLHFTVTIGSRVQIELGSAFNFLSKLFPMVSKGLSWSLLSSYQLTCLRRDIITLPNSVSLEVF